ncbi:MAG: amidase family protein [Candidatus Diapherotrites archaeon]
MIEQTRKALEEIEKQNKKYRHFCLVAKDYALTRAKELDKEKQKGKLSGMFVSVKDAICVKGVESRAGSQILSGYKPPFNATVIENVLAEGAIIVGKTSQDEFGFGTFSTNVGNGFEVPKNPHDVERATGGSSGGCAGWTSLSSFPHVSIAESTGGSIACPAGFCGVAGITPTYGRVSRYGLMDYASSLDKIGAMGKTVREAALLLEVIAGSDGKDATALLQPKENFSAFAGKSAKGMRIGVVKELMGSGIDSGVRKIVQQSIDSLEKQGAKISEISLPLSAKYAIPAYYLIATAEASTNLAKYCGMRYGLEEKLEGNFDEYFSKVRSSAFGKEAKRRIMLGTFARMSGYRDAYYLRALKVRTKIIQEFQQQFKKVNVLAHPAMPFIAPKFKEIEKLSPLQNYLSDVCLSPCNLGGFPHVSVNAGFSKGMPVGILFTSDHLQEGKAIQAASAVEKVKECR